MKYTNIHTKQEKWRYKSTHTHLGQSYTANGLESLSIFRVCCIQQTSKRMQVYGLVLSLQYMRWCKAHLSPINSSPLVFWDIHAKLGREGGLTATPVTTLTAGLIWLAGRVPLPPSPLHAHPSLRVKEDDQTGGPASSQGQWAAELPTGTSKQA